jgi:hypothetical protein
MPYKREYAHKGRPNINKLTACGRMMADYGDFSPQRMQGLNLLSPKPSAVGNTGIVINPTSVTKSLLLTINLVLLFWSLDLNNLFVLFLFFRTFLPD